MSRSLYVVALTATLVVLGHAQRQEYCNLRTCQGKQHTLCKYPFLRTSGSCGRVVSSTLTMAEKQEILNAHNSLRYRVASGAETRGRPGPQPAAKYMPNLQWDNEIASIAQTWADQCNYSHDQCRDTANTQVGQNIAYTASTGPNPGSLTKLINLWYNEVALFDRNGVRNLVFSKDTGHYTQMVWAKTTRLGCGAIRYNSGDGWNKLYLVCNYGPTGNWVGQAIYEPR